MRSSVRIVRDRERKTDADRVAECLGYRAFPNRSTRPHCDMCGPFASRHMRYLYSDEFGSVYRCRGCDEE